MKTRPSVKHAFQQKLLYFAKQKINSFRNITLNINLCLVESINSNVLSTHLGGQGVGELCHWGETKMRGLSIEPTKTRQQGPIKCDFQYRIFEEETPSSDMNEALGLQRNFPNNLKNLL